MNSSPKQSDVKLDDWIQNRKNRTADKPLNPYFESEVLAQIRDLVPQEKEAALESDFSFPKPLSSSLCTAVGLLKFVFCFQLLY